MLRFVVKDSLPCLIPLGSSWQLRADWRRNGGS